MVEHAYRLVGVVLAGPKFAFNGSSENRDRLTGHRWPETRLDAIFFVVCVSKVAV